MELRYILEHKLLPTAVFSANGRKGLMLLLQDCGGMIVDLMTSLGKKMDNNYCCPYSVEDFAVLSRSFDGSNGQPRFFVHRIIMPEPQVPPQCYCVFICHDSNFESISYYTLEKSTGNLRCLCGWTQSGAHLNFGTTDDTPNLITKRIVERHFK